MPLEGLFLWRTNIRITWFSSFFRGSFTARKGGAVTGPAADARGCCRWALRGFGHDHAVGAALVVLDLSALSASAVRAPAMAVWTAGSWAGWWPRSVLRLI